MADSKTPGQVRRTMLFNPYTGKPRHPSDIASDPEGLAMVDPDAPLRPYAPPAVTPAPEQGVGDEPDDLTIAYMYGFEKGRDAGRAMREVPVPGVGDVVMPQPVAWEYRRYSFEPDEMGWCDWGPLQREDVEWFKQRALAEPERLEIRGLHTADQIRDVAAALRGAQTVVPEGWKLVPIEPTEAMWGELARDIVWFLCSTKAPHHGQKLRQFLKALGSDVPAWLSQEIPDVESSPAKGTWAACIWQAMLAAAPPSPTGGQERGEGDGNA